MDEFDMYHKGYDIFHTYPGKVTEKHCAVCGTLCDVQRNVYTAGGFVEAMNREKDLYDVFTCPHAGREWHDEAIELVKEIEETHSKRVADLLRQDLQNLLRENGIL